MTDHLHSLHPDENDTPADLEPPTLCRRCGEVRPNRGGLFCVGCEPPEGEVGA